MSEQKTIETARLDLHRLALSDAERMFHHWTGDANVTRFLRWAAHKTIDDTKSMIQQWVHIYQHDSTYYWGMYLKSGEMIGSIGINTTSEYDDKGELGYKIGMRHEGLLRHYYKTRDGFHDCVIYGIIRNEWERDILTLISRNTFLTDHYALPRKSKRTVQTFSACTALS